MSTTRIQIGPADHGRKMTLDEFREADEEPGYRYELGRGVVEVTEVPNDPHWQVVDNINELISVYRRDYPGVILRVGGGGNCRVWIPEMVSGRNPDVAVVLHGTPQDDRGRQPPSLVAEVVSRRGETRDYVTKREEYLAFGTREYWIVDPQTRQVLVLSRVDHPGPPSWSERLFQGDQSVESPTLPGFTGTVTALWANVESEEGEAV